MRSQEQSGKYDKISDGFRLRMIICKWLKTYAWNQKLTMVMAECLFGFLNRLFRKVVLIVQQNYLN